MPRGLPVRKPWGIPVQFAQNGEGNARAAAARRSGETERLPVLLPLSHEFGPSALRAPRSPLSMTIGLRIPGKAREISFEELCAWAVKSGFESIDLGGNPAPEQISTARKAGLEIGTIDLPGTSGLISADAEKQAAAVETAKQAIAAAAEHDCHRMFCVIFYEVRCLLCVVCFVF